MDNVETNTIQNLSLPRLHFVNRNADVFYGVFLKLNATELSSRKNTVYSVSHCKSASFHIYTLEALRNIYIYKQNQRVWSYIRI